MRPATLLLCAWLAVTAIAVVITGSADAKRPPRAAQILQPAKQTWICPDAYGSDEPIVKREICFIVGWPG